MENALIIEIIQNVIINKSQKWDNQDKSVLYFLMKK